MMGEVREKICRWHSEAAEIAMEENLGHHVHAGRLLDGKDPKYRCVDVSDPLHSQWEEFRGAVMEEFPFPALWHQSP